jgi:hypothetical protein
MTFETKDKQPNGAVRVVLTDTVSGVPITLPFFVWDAFVSDEGMFYYMPANYPNKDNAFKTSLKDGFIWDGNKNDFAYKNWISLTEFGTEKAKKATTTTTAVMPTMTEATKPNYMLFGGLALGALVAWKMLFSKK